MSVGSPSSSSAPDMSRRTNFATPADLRTDEKVVPALKVFLKVFTGIGATENGELTLDFGAPIQGHSNFFFLQPLSYSTLVSSMETDNGPSTTMEIDQTPSPIHLPLNMNCEDAVSFIESHLQSQNVNFNFDFSVLASLSNSAFLGNLSELLLLPELTDSIAIAFFPILSDLVGRWTSLGQEYREQIACALGRLVHIEPKLKRYIHNIHIVTDLQTYARINSGRAIFSTDNRPFNSCHSF